jgi:hypothetical protein
MQLLSLVFVFRCVMLCLSMLPMAVALNGCVAFRTRHTHLHHTPTKTALPGGTFGYLMFVVVMMMSGRERGSERVRLIVGDVIYMCAWEKRKSVWCVWKVVCVCAEEQNNN